MERIEMLRERYPNGEIPDLVVALAEFQESIAPDDLLIGDFVVYPGVFKSKIFADIGMKTNGSTYSYWLYNNHGVNTAPIVYCDTEGYSISVLANSIEDFLALLSLGVKSLGDAAFDAIQGESVLEAVTDPSPNTILYREWLKTVGIELPADPVNLVREAIENHPNFKEWFTENW